MSDFTTVKTWVDTHLRDITDYSHLTKALLLELQNLADLENVSLAKRIEHAMINFQRDDQMRVLTTITLNNYNPRLDNPIDNAFGVVILKAAPFSTDGVFILIQHVPNQYVLKTIIRVDKDYKVISVTHTFLCSYSSETIKPGVRTGTLNGQSQKEIFALKDKIDNNQIIEEVVYGTNDPFKLTLPNGETVIP